MMRRRIYSAVLVLLLALCLAACGGEPREDGGTAGGPAWESEYFKGGMGEVMRTYWFNFTVNSAYVCQSFGEYAAGEGNRLVVVDLSVKNICDFSVDFYREDFQLEWDDANGGSFALALSAKEVDGKDLFPDEYTLKAGKSRDGVLVYEVPASESLDYYITFLETFDDGTEGDVFAVCFTAGAEAAGTAV